MTRKVLSFQVKGLSFQRAGRGALEALCCSHGTPLPCLCEPVRSTPADFQKLGPLSTIRRLTYFRLANRGAFSLLELLVVIGIMAILIGLSMPAIGSRLRASNLSGAAQGVVDQLNFARQTALSRNLPVEVRFYKLADYNEPVSASPKVFRALQSFVLDDTNVVPLVRPQYFSAPVVCSSNVAESPLLSDPITTETTPGTAIPSYGLNYTYRSFYFKPSGATSRQDTNLFLTLVIENNPPLSQGANFFTIQIDPVTGRPRIFRP